MPRAMLIVDDEPDICDCLSSFFSERGFAVQVAYTGHEALERLLDAPPDVVLLDVRLPDVMGLDVLRQAKALCPCAMVVMVTSVTDFACRQDALAAGASAYILKPFDFSESTWAPVLSQLAA